MTMQTLILVLARLAILAALVSATVCPPVLGQEEENGASVRDKTERNRADEQEFVNWLKNNAVPIAGTNPQINSDDLAPLKEILKDKPIVGLGEATHGSREIFQMKHRLLKFLVNEMGFTVFAIEASYSRCKYINDYVMHGTGSLDTATVIQGFTTWRTEEIREMIRWMRTYNEKNPEKKIQFVGYDPQVNDAAAQSVSKFYEKVNDAKKERVDSLLRRVLESEKTGGIYSGDTSIRTLAAPMKQLTEELLHNKERYTAQVSLAEFDEAAWNHRILHQFIVAYSYGWTEQKWRENRDFFMAQNILMWLAYFPQDTKMVVWGHNGHIAKDFLDGKTYPSMGSHLRSALADRYYAVGFDLYAGRFRSKNTDLKNSPDWEDNELKEAPEGNLSYYFVQAGLPDSFVDFTKTSRTPVVNEWLNEREIGVYSLGSRFSSSWPVSEYVTPTKLNRAFDGMVFIKKSSSAIPVERMKIDQYKF